MVDDADNRKRLASELDFALSQEKDPWTEVVQGRLDVNAKPLARVAV